MKSGTYTILLELESPKAVTFGAAGSRELDAGWYAYTGSAQGPGGLSRVDRHQAVCDGRNGTRHWHIDYLLGACATRWDTVWKAPVAKECAIARSLPGDAIDGIGASDCDCATHLQFAPLRTELTNALDRRYEPLNRN